MACFSVRHCGERGGLVRARFAADEGVSFLFPPPCPNRADKVPLLQSRIELRSSNLWAGALCFQDATRNHPFSLLQDCFSNDASSFVRHAKPMVRRPNPETSLAKRPREDELVADMFLVCRFFPFAVDT